MKLKDGEVMNLGNMAETTRAERKIPKKELLNLLERSYKHLDKNQLATIVTLIAKMVFAKLSGENLTVAFRGWNEDGTRRF